MWNRSHRPYSSPQFSPRSFASKIFIVEFYSVATYHFRRSIGWNKFQGFLREYLLSVSNPHSGELTPATSPVNISPLLFISQVLLHQLFNQWFAMLIHPLMSLHQLSLQIILVIAAVVCLVFSLVTPFN